MLFAAACRNLSGASRQHPYPHWPFGPFPPDRGNRPLEPKGSLCGCVGNFKLYQIPREKSRKTEGVFLVGSRRCGGKSKALRASNCKPAQRLQFEEEEPDSEDKRLREQRGARSGEAGSDEPAFSFGEAKENAEGQSQIFNMRSLIIEFLLELCYNAVLYGKYIRLDEQSLVCLHSRDKILPVFKGIQPVFARAIDL